MVSEQLKKMSNLLRKAIQSTDLNVETWRKGIQMMTSMIRIPKNVKTESVNAGGVPAEWVLAPGARNDRVILYLHGGGYVGGSIGSHRHLVAELSRTTNARVLIIDYRIAPEHPFPAALEDSTAAYRWLVSTEGVNPNNLIIAGESAGGGLTLATLLNLRDTGFDLPVAAVCISPWTDLACTAESLVTKKEEDPFITPEFTPIAAKHYLGDTDPKNPLASPLYANLEGLPPLFIQVGTAEVILDDSTRLAEKAKTAGLDVELDVRQDEIHAMALFFVFVPEGKKAIEKITEFVLKYFK